jgi:hypothetical protein
MMMLIDGKLCEFSKMFSTDGKEALTAMMRQWGAELVDVLGASEVGGKLGLRSRKGGGIQKTGEEGVAPPNSNDQSGLAGLLFPIDWTNTSTGGTGKG